MTHPPSQVPDPARSAHRVRCYSCGRHQDPSIESCLRCGATFAGMCSCGVLHSLYAKSCAGCGARFTPKRLPRSKHPAVRAARWGVLLFAAAGAAAVYFSSRGEKPAYALKADGLAHYLAGRYGEAAKSFEAATRAAPRDAQAWYNLATCYRNLGMSQDAYMPSARQAAEIDPGMLEAQMFLTICEREAGNLDAALDHARRAAALSAGNGTAERTIAEIELARPGGDLQVALDALRRAAARDPRNVQGKILTAECYLRLYGTLPAASYPPEVAAAIEQARQAMADPSVRSDTPEGALARAQLQLCAGAPADAYASALDAIDRGGADVPDATRARLLVIRGRSLLAWRDARDAVRTDFVQALELVPTLEMASSISLPLASVGRADLAEDVLTAVAAKNDPAGGVSAALVDLLVRRGALEPAVAAARRAVGARPSDLSYALLLGDALRANRDVPAARAAYERAKALPGGTAEARIALLALDEAAGPTRDAALVSAFDSLAPFLALARPSMTVYVAGARLRIASGDAPAAVTLATRAAEAAPGSAGIWLLLAEAHAASAAPDAPTRAAFALQRARRLLPDDEDICLAEAEALMRATDAVGAVGAASHYLERHPDSARMLKLRGRARALAEQWAESARDLQRTIELNPTDTDAMLLCAESEFRGGDAAAALRSLDRIDVKGQRALADTVALLRLRAQGATVDQAAAALRASGAGAMLARVFLLLGRLGDAAAEARTVLVATPGEPGAVDVLVHAVLDAAPESAAAIAEASRAVTTLTGSAPPSLAATLRARILLAERKWDDAYVQIRPFRDEVGRDAVATFVLGTAALNSGRTQEGLDQIRHSLEIPGGPESLRGAAADAFARASETSDVALGERCARFALTIAPSHPVAAARLADILARRGEFAASAAVAERGLTSSTATPKQALRLRLLAASAETMVGDASLALLNLEQAAKLDPGSSVVALLRGSACLAADDLAGATVAFEEVRRTDPSQALAEAGLIAVDLRSDRVADAVLRAKTWQQSNPKDTQLGLIAAAQMSRSGRFDAAADVLRTTRAAHRDDLTVAESLVSSLVAAGRTADAVAVADDLASQRSKDDASAELVAARLASLQPSTAASAVTRVQRARALPSLTPAQLAATWSIEAEANLRLDRTSEATAAAREGVRALEGNSGVPSATETSLHLVLGTCAFRAGDLTSAIREFQRCVELAPNDADHLNNLAWVLAKSPGKGADGLRFAIRATEQRPRDPNLWDTRAVAADAAGNAGEAEQSRRTCLTLHAADPARSPDSRARVAIALARALIERGRRDEAILVAAEVARWVPKPSADLLTEAATLASP
ncbi:MAG: tetratricopeptide repeat protein [Planctomycetes bacterium]|nr:tetratricopeptide repeat protein [Planctomycetota bacterium]